MLRYALIFFVISLIAGFFGFTGVASGARSISKIFFFLALLVFVIVVIVAFAVGNAVF